MSKLFYLKYKLLPPVEINTQILNTNTFEWIQTIFTVSQLISAAVSEPTRSLLGLPVDFGPLSLHLPDGFYRSDLPEEFFAPTDSTGTTLRPGLALTLLYGIDFDDLNPLIIKSLNDSQQEMVTGWFHENTNIALEKYCDIANILKSENCVNEVCEFLIKITSDKFPDPDSNYPPFVFLEGSSGSGKSQMGFTIKANIGSQRKVYYFLFNPPGLCSQMIYLNFKNISKLFTKCYTKDMRKNSSPSCGLLFNDSLYVYGFIYELLSNGIESSAVVEIGPKTGQEVQQLINDKKLHQSRPVFILDECVAISDESFNKVRFVRNCFRSLGLGLVLLGTDSTAAKLSNNIGNSSRNGDERQWCYVVGKFPALNLKLLESPSDIPDWLKYILSNSRPLFSHLVAAKFKKNSNDFDALMNDVFKDLITVKKIFANNYGKLGQLRLFQNAHYLLDECWDKQSTPLIHSHFAQLNEPEKNFFLMNNGCISGADSWWKPSSAFPKVQDDILLYLLLMGGKDYAAFRLNSQQVPYSQFLIQVKGEADFRSQILDFSNAAQNSNDGMFLESLLCSTVCLASHSNGIQGIGLKEFVLNLVYQLQIDEVKTNQTKISDLEQLDKFNFIVPFLSPANQMWPDSLKQIPGSNFGDLERARNADKFDLKTSCQLFGESKDYGRTINLGIMTKILKRVPKQAIVELVFVRKLQKSYYTQSASSFEKEFSGSHITSKAFYKIDASKPNTILETIIGIPCAKNPDGVVIFFEINDELRL